MLRIRFVAGLLLVAACTALTALQVWRMASPMNCARHLHLCQQLVPPNPATSPVRIYAMLVGIAFGVALMRESRTHRRPRLNAYGAAALIPSSIGDIVINLTCTSSTPNPTADIITDGFCLAIGIYLLVTYRRSKQRKERKR